MQAVRLSLALRLGAVRGDGSQLQKALRRAQGSAQEHNKRTGVGSGVLDTRSRGSILSAVAG